MSPAAPAPQSPATSTLPASAKAFYLVPASEGVVSASATNKNEDSLSHTIFTFLGTIAWPLAVCFIAWRILRIPDIALVFQKISRQVKEVKVVGVEISMSEGAKATIEDVEKLFEKIPDTHKDWTTNSNVGSQFELVVDDLREHLTSRNWPYTTLTTNDFAKFRFTVHVPDVLITGALRQLVKYLGAGKGGAGRIFSERHGIIGKAWRLHKGDYVSHDSFEPQELIEKWGMTKDESLNTSSEKSVYVAILIRNTEGTRLGVFYMDAKSSDLFGPESNYDSEYAAKIFSSLESFVLQTCNARGLTRSLEDLMKISNALPKLDIYNEREKSSRDK